MENVDRLLVSPSNQRGRDFAVMLKSLDDLGYAVEWRILNAGEYGMPQRRRRVFFLGYLKGSKIYKELAKDTLENWILKTGVLAKGFKNSFDGEENTFTLDGDLVNVSNNFNKVGRKSLFKNSGVMIKGSVYTCKTKAVYTGKKRVVLGDILEEGKVEEEFYIDKSHLDRWDYLKSAKKEKRVSSSGFEYNLRRRSYDFSR